MAKYAMLRARIAAELPAVRLAQAEAVADDVLALVHTRHYIDAISHGTLTAAAQREIGFPWSAAMAERARRSVGATVAAAQVAAGSAAGAPGEGVAANLAGGTHHAHADKGSGYCVFNDVAVAARLLQTQQRRQRPDAAPPLPVALIDLDVHQGNGSAGIFCHDPSVFTLSLHGEKNFPFRKEASDLDLALPDGCTDEPYLDALEQALDELERRFCPALIFYLAGADPFAGDRLGRLALSQDGLEARDRRVFDWAWQRRIPLTLVMAGGYGVKIEETVQVQLNTYRVALQYWQRWRALR